MWMSEEEVKAHLPNEFQDYPDTQVVNDCTEVRCQTPSSLLLQSEVFSNYKSHWTFKGLIGMAPHAVVTFVSSLYGPGVAIMVDKDRMDLHFKNIRYICRQGKVLGQCRQGEALGWCRQGEALGLCRQGEALGWCRQGEALGWWSGTTEVGSFWTTGLGTTKVRFSWTIGLGTTEVGSSWTTGLGTPEVRSCACKETTTETTVTVPETTTTTVLPETTIENTATIPETNTITTTVQPETTIKNTATIPETNTTTTTTTTTVQPENVIGVKLKIRSSLDLTQRGKVEDVLQQIKQALVNYGVLRVFEMKLRNFKKTQP
ncbi:unnamed protein product [Leuciscus chuanchicus]